MAWNGLDAAWQLRVYLGTDPEFGRPRWLSKTVHGTRRFARQQLEDLVIEGGRARIRAGTLADLPTSGSSRVSGLVRFHREPHPLHRRVPSQAASRRPRPGPADYRGHRRLLRTLPAGWPPGRPAARPGYRRPRPRRAPPSPRSGRQVGLDLAVIARCRTIGDVVAVLRFAVHRAGYVAR
jgi:hypothetical protein